MQTQSVDQLVGHVLGTYRLERLLGHGRLNAVYLAWHLETQKNVALTLLIIPEQYSLDARKRFMQRFYKNAATLTALQHPHVLPVYDHGEYVGYPYLVTPYMMNGSLADLLKQEGRFAHGDVCEILEQIVAGLAYAHNKGVLHGTLKPSNIVLSADRKMQVAGLGLMHIQQMRGIEQSNHPQAHLLSIAGTFLLNPEYSAPEVVQGQAVDIRSDIYALGIILFELLSGKTPFSGTNPLEVANMHVKQQVPLLRTVCADVPVAIASVVNQALERDPARRFQNVSELVEAFTQTSWGATGPVRATKKAEMPSLRSTDQLKPEAASTGSSQNWQFLPPIITSKTSVVMPPAQTFAAGKAPAMAPAAQVETNLDATISWQLQPPVITASLPSMPSSAVKAKETSGEIPTPGAKHLQEKRASVPFQPALPEKKPATLAPNNEQPLSETEAWWSTPQALLLEQQLKSGKLSSQTRSSERSKAKSTRGTERRRLVALLAAGGALAVGAVVVLNSNLLHMAQNSMNPTPTASNNVATTGAMNGQDNNKMHQQQNGQTTTTNNTQQKGQQQVTGHTGTIIGMSTQTLNSSQLFNNPTDAKSS